MAEMGRVQGAAIVTMDPLERLAIEENHDADIPSNAGVFQDPFTKTDIGTTVASASSASNHERDDRDVEKWDRFSTVGEGHRGEAIEMQDRKEPGSTATPTDPHIVDWDGPDDPQNPLNWTKNKKGIAVFVLSMLTLVTPLASSMFAPGVPSVMKEFGTTSQTLAEFVVSVYILGFAIGPLLISPLSEMWGRYPVYIVTYFCFIIFTIACAVAKDMGSLIVFRFFSGCFGVTPVTIGGGTIADLFPAERRGAVMAIWAMGPLLGPVIGPVAGGYLSASMGWRWVFWIIAIAAGFFAILCAIFTRETYAPVILARKAKRLRKQTGNPDLRSKLDTGLTSKEMLLRAIIRPSKMLLFSPIVLLMSIYMSVIYGLLYLLFTTFTFVFEQNYGFTEDNVGLVYIAMGIGMLLGLAFLGFISDRLSKKLAAKNNNGVMKPEYRLPPLIVGGFFIPVGMFIYGWGTDKQVQWAVPLLGTLFVGMGIIAAFMCIQTYLIDAFTVYAASAIAANTVLRSIFGAFLPLAGLDMYDALGLGWGNSLLGFIALGLIPIPGLFYKYGEHIRTRFKVQF
ncbi:hypothetical protein MBLNU457_1953t1 [Dothideomycetes sp. NU457]